MRVFRPVYENQKGRNVVRIFALGFAGLLAFAGLAEAAIYECEIKNRSRDGVVPPKYWVILENNDQQVSVFDGRIAQLYGENALPVRSTRRGENKFMLKYKLEEVPGTDGPMAIDYRATFDRAALTVRVNGVVSGYANNSHGSGACKKIR